MIRLKDIYFNKHDVKAVYSVPLNEAYETLIIMTCDTNIYTKLSFDEVLDLIELDGVVSDKYYEEVKGNG